MTEIDYRVLSKDLASAYIGPRLPGVPFEGWWERDAPKEAWERVARAVVAALRDQGLVVVRSEGTAMLDGILTRPIDPQETTGDILTDVRLASQLMAAPSEGYPR